MDLITNISYIIGALILIILSADRFIDSAAQLAKILNIPSIIIGTLIIGFGNALPEIAISITSALNESTTLAIGNAYGSNIVNTTLVLGIICILAPIKIKDDLINQLYWMWGAVCGATFLIFDNKEPNELTRLGASILLIVCIIYVYKSIRDSLKQQGQQPAHHEEINKSQLLGHILITLVGLTVLSLGSKLFIYGATNLAHLLNISEYIIGLTIAALGTSMPELFSSLIALYKEEHDLAIGNLIGSNIFNMLGLIGIAGVIHPTIVDNSQFVYDGLIIFAVVTFIIFRVQYCFKLSRLSGVILLLAYALDTSLLLLL